MINANQKPTVHIGDKQIPFTIYQLLNAEFCLKLFSKGMKVRGVNLKNIRLALNLKSKNVNDAIVEVRTMIEDYKANVVPLVSGTNQN